MGELPQALRGLRLELLGLDPSIGGLSPEHQQLVARSTARPDGEIAEMIAAGESQTIEFKSTLRVNLKTGERDKRMRDEVLKNIAAFLNTDGGTLVVGVKDDGEPLGLDADGFTNEDKMVQHLSSLVRDHIGASAWKNIDYKIEAYQGKRILVIRCTKSNLPVHVGADDEFYIRTGTSVEQLKTQEYKRYVDDHF